MPRDKSLKPVRWPPDMLISKFKPRTVPLVKPDAGIFDDPYGCARINFKWLSHVLGAVQVLLEDDAWEGDPDDIWEAQQEIEKFCNELGNPCGVLWEGTLLRQNPDDFCQLEQSQDGGATWTLAFDYGLCQSFDSVAYYSNSAMFDLQLEALYDGTPGSIDGDAPDTLFAAGSDDSGLDGYWREVALCTAVGAYVDSIVAGYLETLGSYGAVFNFASSLLGLFGPLGGILAFSGYILKDLAFAYGSAPFQNDVAIANVKCALYNELLPLEINQDNLQQALNDIYPPPPSSHEGEISHTLRSTYRAHSKEIYLKFLKLLAQGYRLAKADVLEPCDCQTWEKTFFGGEGDVDGIIASYPVYGEYDAVNDWAIGTVRDIAGGTNYLQVWIQVYSSYVMHITRVQADIEWNMPVIDTDGDDTYYVVVSEVPPPDEIIQEVHTGLHPAATDESMDTGEIDLETTGFYVSVISRHNDASPGTSVARIKSLTISGKGLNPFEVGGGG